MRIQCISRPMATCSLPTIGMLFSDWQATRQALQPMQEVRSIDIPHWWSLSLISGWPLVSSGL